MPVEPRAPDLPAPPVEAGGSADAPPGPAPAGMRWVPGGSFTMGSDRHYPEEGPAHRVRVDGFWIDEHAVTRAQFAAFVEATGYVTVAERELRPEDYPGVPPESLVCGSGVFRQPAGPVDLRDPSAWWAYQPGASWRDTPPEHGAHPVVHVCFEDAQAYADWAGKLLPTEAQWERAARGGLDGEDYAWGGQELRPGGRELANTWLGEFPWEHRRDRPPGPVAVRSYPPNGYGLYEMIGNVWEWTSDFFRPGHDAPRGDQSSSTCCGLPRNPTGPSTALAEPASPTIPLRVLKGGSFLCAPNYCERYRPAARIPQASDTGSVHIGFRCVASPSKSCCR